MPVSIDQNEELCQHFAKRLLVSPHPSAKRLLSVRQRASVEVIGIQKSPIAKVLPVLQMERGKRVVSNMKWVMVHTLHLEGLIGIFRYGNRLDFGWLDRLHIRSDTLHLCAN